MLFYKVYLIERESGIQELSISQIVVNLSGAVLLQNMFLVGMKRPGYDDHCLGLGSWPRTPGRVLNGFRNLRGDSIVPESL